MSKDILFKDDVKTKLLKGININADCVKVTLGPEGKLVTIENQYGTPRFTKDGVSVSNKKFYDLDYILKIIYKRCRCCEDDELVNMIFDTKICTNKFIHWHENKDFPNATVDKLKELGWNKFYEINKNNSKKLDEMVDNMKYKWSF